MTIFIGRVDKNYLTNMEIKVGKENKGKDKKLKRSS